MNKYLENNQVLISLKSVSKSYGHINALTDINLEVNSGDVISIFGENGAGKSTLLKIISMQTKSSSGEISFIGKKPSELDDKFRMNFGVISHNSFLYENLSAFENLMFYGSLYNTADLENKINYLLKRLDIYKRKDDLIRTYSRGMQQKVSIARSLLNSPKILFLDEPYSGLDNVSTINLTNILKEEIDNNITLVMITHNLDIGYDIGHKLLILNKGRIVFNDTKDNIDKTNFYNKYFNFASNMEITK